VVVASEAKQSDEVVARAKPVAISRVPSLRSGQGFVATLLAMTRGWTFYEFIKIGMTFKEHRKIFLLLVCFSLVALRDFSVGQEINERGWPIPDLRGLSPYSITIQEVNGAEKIVEKMFYP